MKKLELKPTQPVEIDWSKPQWVQSIAFPNRIVLTTGVHKKISFSGTIMPCDDYPIGEYTNDWAKDNFQVLEGEITFIISNND